jgi:aspartate aminotransferase-like enzyme
MIPGPSPVDPDILSILSDPVMPHYGEEWKDMFAQTRENLQQIFDTQDQVMIFPTPANIALEMATLNLIRPKGKVLNLTNGFFGEMIEEILVMAGRVPVNIPADHGHPIDPEDVRQALEEQGDIEAVFLVHNETSTAVMNPIEEIARIVKKHPALLVVDSVSAFGGAEIAVDDWGVDFCIGYASKCLSSVNGVVPVAISREAWDEIFRKNIEVPRYLNLRVWRRFENEWGSWVHPYPSSMPTSVILAMKAAVEKALAEGLASRYRRHKAVGLALREAMRRIGLKSLPDERVASPTVSVIEVPDQTDKKIRKILTDKSGIMVAGGLSDLRGRVLRIGHMGVAASREYLIPTVQAIEEAMREIGLLEDVGEGAEKAMSVLDTHGV